MTADVLPADRQRTAEAGMNDFIGKPFELAQLFRTLKRWLPVDEIRGREPREPTISDDKSASEVIKTFPDTLGELQVAEAVGRFHNDRSIYLTIARKFFETEVSTADKIEAAIVDKNYEEARRLAHALKGNSGYIGAGNLANLSSKLEDAIKKSDFAALPDLLAPVRQLLAEVIENLAELVDL
jgi:HPt (histidine-containing phosphotransfer) domain-containing protein